MTKARRTLVGGPWNGHVLPIGDSGTLVFSVGNYRGRYNRLGYWVSEQHEN